MRLVTISTGLDVVGVPRTSRQMTAILRGVRITCVARRALRQSVHTREDEELPSSPKT